MIDPQGSTGALSAVVIALAVLVPGCLALLGRRDPLGVLLAVIGSALVTSAAGLLAVLTRTPTRPWFIVAAVAVVGGGFVRRHVVTTPRHAAPWWLAVAPISVATLAALPVLTRAPVQWDARSIWFFHASWFASADVAYTDLATAEAFSHPDYPPLAPSLGGFAWFFGDGRNDWTPQLTTGALTLAGIGLLVTIVATGVADRRVQAATVAALSLVAIATIQGNGFDGYVDGTAALLLAVVIMSTVLDDVDPTTTVLAALALALVKNEAFLFLLVVVVPLHLVSRRSVRPLAPAIAAGLAWVVAIRLPGLDLESWQIENALPWSTGFSGRLADVAAAITGESSLRAAALSWAGAALLAGTGSSGPAKRIVAFTGAAGAAMVVVLVGVYLATPSDLSWHLDASVDRLVINPALVLGAGAVAAAARALDRPTSSLEAHPADSGQPGGHG